MTEYTRITEILSPFSGLSKVNEKVLENACWRGTRVHQICQSIVEDLGEWDVEPELKGYINSFKSWYQAKPNILEIEKRYYCDDLKITGQIDLIVGTKQNATIIDIKTPSRPSNTWPVQGSAYAYLAVKNGYNIQKIQFLQLFKDGKPAKIHQYERCFDFFLKCLHVYRYFFEKKDRPMTKIFHNTPQIHNIHQPNISSLAAQHRTTKSADWGDTYEDFEDYKRAKFEWSNFNYEGYPLL